MSLFGRFCRATTRPILAQHVVQPFMRISQRLSRLNHTTSAPTRNLTEIEKIVLGNVKATGPISFATYMQLCLAHPIHGYYMNSSNDVFGTKGDFITSPEISQIFGELIGIWFLSQWSRTTNKPPIRILELGPGRGTLMDDILRVFKQIGPKGGEINVHFVETSPAMRSLQVKKFSAYEETNIKLHWHNVLGDIQPSSTEYTMLVAHEFFDALPFHVIQKKEGGWHEVLIAPTEQEQAEEDSPNPQEPTLRRVLAPAPSAVSTVLGSSSPRFKDLPVDSILEVSPTSYRLAYKIGQLLSNEQDEPPLIGGCGLIIDYGGDKSYGDSFRAFRNHKLVDIFHEPGNCDLTTNVDFAFLKEAMTSLVQTYGPISQRDFLNRMGIGLRLETFLKSLPTQEQRDQFTEAAARLVDPRGMGSQYQVMGILAKPKDLDHNKDAQVWPFVDVAVEK